MKKNYTPKLIVAIALLFSGIAKSNAQTITLTPTSTGSEANTLYTDASTLQIDASGVVSYYNSNSSDDWTVSAETITQASALNKIFSINWGGMAMTNTTEGNNYGKMLTQGGIDRASSGELGIRGLNGDVSITVNNGIDNKEGFFFGLDLSNLGTDVAVQITKISVIQLAATGETGQVVSLLDPTQRINFGNSTLPAGGSGTIDISSLRLYIVGGSINNAIVSVFNNTPTELASNWRISKLELKVVALSTLPVSLASFMATTQAQAVKLQWKTLSEQNNKEFIVLRSSDGSAFSPIATLPGAGNSNSPKSYQFYDRNAVNGTNYYTLIQIDNDGNRNEIATQAVGFKLQSTKVSLSPNPSYNEVSITFKPGIYHSLALINIQGKVLQTISVEQNTTEAKMNLRQYPSGTYLVKLQGEQATEICRLIKR